MQPLAMELIDFQNGDSFPKKLANIVGHIFSDIADGKVKNNQKLLTETNYGTAVEKLIKERFNLNVKMDSALAEYLPAAIVPFSSDYLSSVGNVNGISSSFFAELFGSTNIFKHIRNIEKTREEYYKRIHNRSGFVDTKHARVGGYLSDVKHFLVINFFSLKKEGLTPDEVVSVITHEIGHAFEGLETHYKLMTNNSSIMDVLNDLNKNKPDKAYYTFKRHFGGDELEKAGLNKDSAVVDFYGPVASRYISTLESQFINNKYDQTNYENLADSFATRFGLGKDLVTGLNKIHRNNPSELITSGTSFFFLYFIEVMIFALFMCLLGLGGIIIFGLIFTFFSGSDKKDMTYDMPVDRYVRIRNTIVQNLKNKNLPREYSEELVNQFIFIDDIINKSGNMKGLLDILADYVKPSSREVFHYVKVQQTIENSLNNSLFVKSAQLRHI